ncbi:VapC ribonuclease [Acrocarpospora corrugata]|uniref:VapC ribonuclease n=1 Tax=Acrocarpospora corrugata TaxID=35763 RepID=A0A5M3W628_9ACTN|nr:type II toxin-antitoxin system VapC family toxin [Acrocarpospora corrugata]GES04475.1 VapC ribonuclease [Acrocarpospora corrugata]
MIIDSSAIIAVINGEPEATPFAYAIAVAVCRISAVNYIEAAIEAAIVADNRGEAMRNAFDTLVDEMGLIIEPVTPNQARIARWAYQTYGKGNNSKAKLNMGDCFAYALAKDLDQPLLFKGEDFPHTDITPAQP